MSRLTQLFVALAIIVCGSLAADSRAQTYPAKPVVIVVPFAVGGTADVTARIVAQKLSERMGQQFVVENKPGAGGIVAAQSVAQATTVSAQLQTRCTVTWASSGWFDHAAIASDCVIVSSLPPWMR